MLTGRRFGKNKRTLSPIAGLPLRLPRSCPGPSVTNIVFGKVGWPYWEVPITSPSPGHYVDHLVSSVNLIPIEFHPALPCFLFWQLLLLLRHRSFGRSAAPAFALTWLQVDLPRSQRLSHLPHTQHGERRAAKSVCSIHGR